MKSGQLPEKFRNSKKYSYFLDKKGELKRVPKKQTTVSRIRKEAEEAEYGKLLGAIKAKNKVGIWSRLKELIWKKFEELDPLKAVALIAATITVNNFLGELDEDTVKKILKWEISTILVGPFQAAMINIPQEIFENYEPAKDVTGFSLSLWEQKPPKEKKTIAKNSWQFWMLSFLIAYILVEHGGEVLGLMLDGGKGLGSLVTALVGTAA